MPDTTTGSDTPQIHPYSHGALIYYRKGWTDVFPLGHRDGPRYAKSPVPIGVTGYDGKPIGWQKIKATTLSPAGRRNLGIRMPRHIVCLDVDQYEGHEGLTTLAGAESSLGDLPPTYRNSARGLTESGHRYFRLPVGMTLRTGAEGLLVKTYGPNIEILHHFHRYAVAWPSLNPDAGLAPYLWYTPDGVPMTGPPAVVSVPLLPERWVAFLCVPADSPDAASRGGNLRAPRGETGEDVFDDGRQRWRRSVMELKALEHLKAVLGMTDGTVNSTLGGAGIAYGRYAEAGLFTLDEARALLEAAARRNGVHSDEWNRRHRKGWTLDSRLDDALSQGINHKARLEIIEDVEAVNVFEQLMKEIGR